jgi:hypothetical protein
LTVRNPLVVGAVAFPAFLAIEFVLMPAYPPYHLLGDSLACYGVYALLFPLGLGTLLFTVFFRRRLRLPRAQLMLCYQSFMASFLFLLACHDLVQNVNRLSAVDLFLKPLALAAMMVLVSHAVASWRSGRKALILELGLLAVAQLVAALGMALVWINLPVPGILVMVPVIGAAVFRAAFPWRWPIVAGGA